MPQLSWLTGRNPPLQRHSSVRTRILIVATIWILAFSTPFAPAADLDTADVPTFWTPKESLPRPDLSARRRFRFLTSTDFRPFNFLDAQGRLSGFHVDLARAICAELAISERCEIQALPWAELEPAIAAGNGEAILAGIAVTAESRKRLGFTRPYLRFPARFVTARGAPFAEPLFAAIQGKKIGVIAGTAHERLLRDQFGAIEISTFPDQQAMLAALESGTVDAAFGDGLRFAAWLGEAAGAKCCRFAGGPYLAPDYLGAGLAIATRADDADLVAAFDAALQQLSAKGTFAELYLRYFPIGFF